MKLVIFSLLSPNKIQPGYIYCSSLSFVMFGTAHIITSLRVWIFWALLTQPIALHGPPAHPVVLAHDHVSSPPWVKTHPVEKVA